MTIKQSLSFLLFLIALSAFGQQYPFIQYDTKDGLAQSQVRAIQQDENGYIWFGTQGGLSRFDGYEFVNYSTEDGLPSNQINCFLVTEDKFWIGSTGSLAYKKGNRFETVAFPTEFASSRILDLEEDSEGNIWAALAGEGILKYDGNRYSHFGEQEGLSNNYVRSLDHDIHGALWAGTRAGISKIENGKIDSTSYSQLNSTNLSISEVYFTSSGIGIVCTFGHGLFIFENDSLRQLTDSDGLQSNHIRCVRELPSGELWFGSREGLSVLRDNKIEVFRESDGIQYSNIKSLGVDREGNLWMGTDGKGVLLQAGRSFTSFTLSDGLHSDLILSICKRSDSDLLFASYDNGIANYDGETFTPYIYNDFLPSNTVWVVKSDQNGTIWAGTSNGLYRELNGQITILNEENGLSGNRVTALEQIDSGYLVGSENGLSKIDFDGNLKMNYNDQSGFYGKRIRSIISEKSRIWIGAEDALYQMQGEKLTKHIVHKDKETAIYSLTLDPFNRLWIGTSNGLFVTDKDKIKIQEVEFSSGFSAKNVNFLECLKDSTLLVGTNNGLFRLGVNTDFINQQLEVKHYTYFEGLKSSETNQNSAYLQDNFLWFGTTSGVVRFQPEDYSQTAIPPVLNLTDVQLFLEKTDWSPFADSVSMRSGIPINPELPFNKNYITFSFSGISLSNPDKVRYRYTLDGADETWLGPTKNRAVTYASLPHGEYTFKLESYSEDQPNNVAKSSFHFTIKPPFYLRTWFFILVTVVLSAILYLIYLNRVKKEEEKRANLQLKFQSRLMELESQSLNSSMNRHFIFNSLNSIQYYINMQDRKSANRYLTSFAKLIRKNLDSSQQNETTLKDELERLELYLSLEQMRFSGRFDYKINIGPEVNTEDVKIPAMMLQPFLENSIWHGILPNENHGVLTVGVNNISSGIEIKIEDNGIGVETSKKLKVDSGNGHISQGMDITQSRIQLYRNMTGLKYEIKGPYEITSESNIPLGTIVTINLPYKFGG